MSVHVQFCGYRAGAHLRPCRWFLVLGEGRDFGADSQLLVSRSCDHELPDQDIIMYGVPAELVPSAVDGRPRQTLASPLGDLTRSLAPVLYRWHQASLGRGEAYGLVQTCVDSVWEERICRVSDTPQGLCATLSTGWLLEAELCERRPD